MRLKLMTSLVFAGFLCGPAISAELGAPAPGTYVPQYHFALPPERHVLEVVNFSSFGLRFLINGHYFSANPLECPGWVAGDRVTLVAGDWHGYCATAVFHDLTRHLTCRMACDSLAGPFY
jgi:hypothetical protein